MSKHMQKENTRVRILSALSGKELSFSELANITKISRRILHERLKKMEEKKEVLVSLERSKKGPPKVKYRFSSDFVKEHKVLFKTLAISNNLANFSLEQLNRNVKNIGEGSFILEVTKLLTLNLLLEVHMTYIYLKPSDLKISDQRTMLSIMFSQSISKLSNVLLDHIIQNPKDGLLEIIKEIKDYRNVAPDLVDAYFTNLISDLEKELKKRSSKM